MNPVNVSFELIMSWTARLFYLLPQAFFLTGNREFETLDDLIFCSF